MDPEVKNVELDHSIELLSDQQPHFTCDYCNQSFTLKCNLVSHIRAHIGDKPHCCEICNESFSTKSGLALHFRTHKDIGATYRSASPENHRFVCSYCDKGFSLKSNLILHIRTHTGEKPYRCSYCNKTSATKYNLLSHIRTHYSQKTIKCGYCDKYFSSRKNLHSHVQIHISTKRYYCSYCDKSSIHKGTLRVHERIHTGERPYKCIYCSKSFNHRSNLTHHVRIHTGERPFVCKYCNKAFRQKYALDGHERIHTGAKPYVCVDCNKSFPYSASLRSHMKMHDGDQVYTCYYCMRSFNTKVSLSLHIRVHSLNKNTSTKYVNKEDEILLQRALELQSTAPMRKNHYKADPLVGSNVAQKTEEIHYNNPQVDSVVNVLLTPEMKNNLVQDLNDTSATGDLKNRLKEQLCKFISKYSLKNLPNKKVPFKSVSVVSTKPNASIEFFEMKPTLQKMSQSVIRPNFFSQTTNPGPVVSPDNSNDANLRASAIEEIEKLGLKERISTQLKTIVNSGMMNKERNSKCRSVVVQLPPSRENNLKNEMNNRLQKLFQSNLVKRFDTLASQKIEVKEKQECVQVKLEATGVQDMLNCSDEINQNLSSEIATNFQCTKDNAKDKSDENAITEPISEVHIKMENEETEEGVIC